MNFLGHALAATWRDPEPAFVLGAMLPDFARAAGPGSLATAHARVRDGIAWHHHTDAAFHALPQFVAACRRAQAQLESAGVRRGPTLAAAHVGTELLLDAELARDDALLAVAASALELELDLGRGMLAVTGRVRSFGLGPGPRAAAAVLERLVRLLSLHPRLALAPSEHDAVLAWLEPAQLELRDAAATWTEALRARIL
ncbi:MAG: hypothetical protein K1X88_09230 [Nannocystaceae bacterium]|nr:hypothetical protein [Nannocystaceae bacterium]